MELNGTEISQEEQLSQPLPSIQTVTTDTVPNTHQIEEYSHNPNIEHAKQRIKEIMFFDQDASPFSEGAQLLTSQAAQLTTEERQNIRKTMKNIPPPSERNTYRSDLYDREWKRQPEQKYLVAKKPFSKGGTGEVYLAYDLHRGHLAMIKQMRPDRPLDQEFFTKQLEREAATVANLEHRTIPKVYDFFIRQEQGEKKGYMVMEALIPPDYDNLQDFIANNKNSLTNQHFTNQQITNTIDDLADFFEYTQRRGLRHRDIKPANFFVNHEGHIKVVDFDISNWATPTPPGEIFGTPQYIPVETLPGRNRKPTMESDVYTMGLIAFELLTGAQFHEAQDSLDATWEAMKQKTMQSEDFNRPDSIFAKRKYSQQTTAKLQGILSKALAQNPQERYHSPREFALQLRYILRQEFNLPSAVENLLFRIKHHSEKTTTS